MLRITGLKINAYVVYLSFFFSHLNSSSRSTPLGEVSYSNSKRLKRLLCAGLIYCCLVPFPFLERQAWKRSQSTWHTFILAEKGLDLAVKKSSPMQTVGFQHRIFKAAGPASQS